MEVQVNREIRSYNESLFFGLSLRQSVFSALGLATAVGLYFWLKPCVGVETVSWMCVVGAAPFAALGFVQYHGMNAEQLLWAWLRTQILEPRQLKFDGVHLFDEVRKAKEIRKSVAGGQRNRFFKHSGGTKC